jgi:hypothetical protein
MGNILPQEDQLSRLEVSRKRDIPIAQMTTVLGCGSEATCGSAASMPAQAIPAVIIVKTTENRTLLTLFLPEL